MTLRYRLKARESFSAIQTLPGIALSDSIPCFAELVIRGIGLGAPAQ